MLRPAHATPIVVLGASLFGCRLTPADYVSLGEPAIACDRLDKDATVTPDEREAARLAFLQLVEPFEICADDTPPATAELEHARALYPRKRVDAVPIRFVPHLPHGVDLTFAVRFDAASETPTFLAPATGAELYHLAGLRGPSEGDRLDDPIGAMVGASIDLGVRLLTLGLVRPGFYPAAASYPNPFRKPTPEEAESVGRVARWTTPETDGGWPQRRVLLFVEGNTAEAPRPPTSRTMVSFSVDRRAGSPDDVIAIMNEPLPGCEVTHYYDLPLPPGDSLPARVTRALRSVKLGADDPAHGGRASQGGRADTLPP